ncbi:MAG: hypothetical protein ACP5SB_02510 [Caldisericaceae bacterium]
METILNEINTTLSNSENLCEYDFLVQLEKMLLLNGTEILLGELNMISGYASRFIYDYSNPLIFNESIPFIKENLSHLLGIKITTLNLDSFDFNSYKLPFIIYPENLLIFAIDERGVSKYHRMFEEESDDIQALVKKNLMVINFESHLTLKRADIYKKNIFEELLVMIVSDFKKFAVSSYEDFAVDLRSEKKSFLGLSHLWLNKASYSQWTALYGLRSYFLGQFHFAKRGQQEVLRETISGIEDALLYWKEWGRSIGRESNFDNTNNTQFASRLRAANAVDRARKSMESVVKKLESLL